MKKLVSILLTAVMLTVCLAPCALAAGSANVTVNGKSVVWTDAKPFVNSVGRTMVPLRAVADAMGLDVSWNNSTRTATFTRSGVAYNGKCPWTNSISFTIGKTTAQGVASANWVNSEPDIDQTTVRMNTAAIIQGGRTYAPVRYLAEYFGCTVGWVSSTRTATIVGDLPAPKVNFVKPTAYPGVNLLKGTWEVDCANWTDDSLRKIGIVQDTVHLIFQPGGKMAYKIFNTVHQGTYLLNKVDNPECYAVATLDNGWTLNISLYNMCMTASGLPTIKEYTASGSTYSTNAWGFYHLNNNTSFALDPWLQ